MDPTYVAEIANFIFDDTLEPDDVTEKIADVAAQAFHAAMDASKALDLVPRPLGRPSIVWLMLQAVQAFWRRQGTTRIHTSAKETAKWKWRSAYLLAKEGL
jgi:hypothetical protein